MSTNWFLMLQELVGAGAIPSAAHRLLLSGAPGTGKSYSAYALFGSSVIRIACHSERLPETLMFGTVALSGGDTVEIESPIARAMRFGQCVLLDEIDRLPPSCFSSLLAALDDRETASVSSEITGEVIRPSANYCVIATTNELPSALDGALVDRFDLLIDANQPSEGLLEHLPSRSRQFLKNLLGTSSTSLPVYGQAISPRALSRFERLANALSDQQAADLVFGANADQVLSSLSIAQAR